MWSLKRQSSINYLTLDTEQINKKNLLLVYQNKNKKLEKEFLLKLDSYIFHLDLESPDVLSFFPIFPMTIYFFILMLFSKYLD
jgi:hypothetical protein